MPRQEQVTGFLVAGVRFAPRQLLFAAPTMRDPRVAQILAEELDASLLDPDVDLDRRQLLLLCDLLDRERVGQQADGRPFPALDGVPRQPARVVEPILRPSREP